MIHRDERGLTLVELVLGIFLIGVLALGVQSAALVVSRSVAVGSTRLQQSANLGRALELLSEDLRQPAASGISIGGSTYGSASTMTLTWTDLTTTPVTDHAVTYAISSGALRRVATRTQGASVTSSTIVVARDLDAAGPGGGAQFTRTVGAPGVVLALITVRVDGSVASSELTVEQRP